MSKNTAIFYLTENKGLFLNKSLKSPLELVFPKDTLAHLEIVDLEKLKDLISKFIENKKIEASPLFIILGENTTFEKDLTDVAKPERYEAIQKFQDLVPFEKNLSKVFKIQKKEKLIVANRDLCLKLVDIFTSLDFSVVAIISQKLFPENLSRKKEGLDFTLVLKKISSLKQHNLLDSYSQPKKPIDSSDASFFEKNRLIILSLVFAVLIIALGVLIYFRL